MRDCRLTIMGLGLTLTITRKSCKLYLAKDLSELRQTSTQSSRTFIFNVYLICIPFVSFLKAMPAPIPVWQYSCYPIGIRNSHTTHPPLTPPPQQHSLLLKGKSLNWAQSSLIQLLCWNGWKVQTQACNKCSMLLPGGLMVRA